MINWWQSDEMQGYVQDALIHINGAREAGLNNTEQCKRLCDALNKLWSGHNQAYHDLHGHYYDPKPDEHPSDNKSLFVLLTQGIQAALQKEIATSQELRQLTQFEPKIRNHDVLRRKGYRPGQQIEPALLRKASEAHDQLAKACVRFASLKSGEAQTAVLKKTAQLIYIVRSNIAHGEKTPYGPDTEKVRRDEQVCAKVVPLLSLVIKLIFNKPDHRFLVYGTLAPDQPNYAIVEKLRGTWIICRITGKIEETNGFRHLRWNPYGDEVEVQMLVSGDLPQAWPDIDRFEGNDYQRILVPAKVEGTWVIANTYQ